MALGPRQGWVAFNHLLLILLLILLLLTPQYETLKSVLQHKIKQDVFRIIKPTSYRINEGSFFLEKSEKVFAEVRNGIVLGEKLVIKLELKGGSSAKARRGKLGVLGSWSCA